MANPGTRRTKIVCTLGPSSDSPEVIRELILAGMNVARLNFSHGTHEAHRKTFETIRSIAGELNRNVAIMTDLQGPKIRTGPLAGKGTILLCENDEITITTRKVPGDEKTISTVYERLPDDVQPGDSIFLADGMLEFEVLRTDPPDVMCRVVHGGTLGEHKGINLPGVNVSAASLTEKDVKDLELALEMGADFVALSFVRTADDIRSLRKRIDAADSQAAIVAKIERPEAIENFDQILDATDVVMLARGDLGVEVPLDEVPQIQKELIAKCNNLGVPVITATQMLESMVSSVRPTRAEVADVANAIYDGTDAVMLSGETAAGEYPVRACTVMGDIAANADHALSDSPTFDRIVRMRQSGIRKGQGSFGDAIGQAACRTAEAIDAVRIVCFTKQGFTAALIARYRPSVPVTAITIDEETRRRCAIIWGVDAVQSVEPCNTDEMDQVVDDILLEHKLAAPNDKVVIAGGIPLAIRTLTNMLKLHRVRTD